MSKKEETGIQEDCQKVFKDRDCFVYKTHGDIYVRAGIPDLVACVPTTIEDLLNAGYAKDQEIGLFVGVEVKTPSTINIFDYTRKAQEIVGKEIIKANGIWFVTDTHKDVEKLLTRVQNVI